jgi:hypothetical protein
MTSLGPGIETPPQNTTCKEEEPFTKPSKTTPNWPRTDQQQHNPKTHGLSNSSEANPTKGTHWSNRSRASVRPIEHGQLGMNKTRGSTPPNPSPNLSIRSMDPNKTFGIVGTAHGNSIIKLWSTKTRRIKRNRRNSAKNTTNPRTKKTPKSSPFLTDLRGESKRKEPRRFHAYIPQQIPKRMASKSLQENRQEKAPKITKKGKPGRTQTSLEEPRRIIYTYHEGSYKV